MEPCRNMGWLEALERNPMCLRAPSGFERRRHRRQGLNTSTAITITGLSLLFSAQWVVL